MSETYARELLLECKKIAEGKTLLLATEEHVKFLYSLAKEGGLIA